MIIRLGLVDDDPHIHDAIGIILRDADDIDLIGQAYDGPDALKICREGALHVLLMDVVMPGGDGATATRDVLAAFPDVKVLGLSNHQDYEYIHNLLDAGAVGYLIKTAIASDLLNTIRATAQGNSVMSTDVTRTLLSPPTNPADFPPDFGLTDREISVLRLVALGKNNKEAAYDLSVSERTIRFHVGNILDKLGVATRSEALVLAAKTGLV